MLFGNPNENDGNKIHVCQIYIKIPTKQCNKIYMHKHDSKF